MRQLLTRMVRRKCGNPACDAYGGEIAAGAEVCSRCAQAPRRGVRLASPVTGALALLAVVLLGAGLAALRHVQARSAEQRQAHAAALARQRAEHSLARGRSRIGLHLYEEARREYADATRADPGYAMAWADLGAVDTLLGRSGEALEAHEKALALDPGNWLAHYNLGLAAARRGDREGAFSHLRQALARLAATSGERRLVVRDLVAEPALAEVRRDSRFAGLLAGEAASPAEPPR